MLARLRSRLTYANVMATVAVFIALGGTSYAAARIGSAQIKNNSVQGKDIRNSTIGSRDVKNRSLLGADFKSGQLPTRLFASVSSGGSLNFGSGVTSASRVPLQTGAYTVTFNRDVRRCVYLITQGVGSPAGTGDSTESDTTATATISGTNTVSVATRNAAQAQNRSFFLAVLC